jgi:hypothetical protein
VYNKTESEKTGNFVSYMCCSRAELYIGLAADNQEFLTPHIILTIGLNKE